MQTSIEELHQSLIEYRDALIAQSSRLNEDVEQLTHSWNSLSEAYGGETGEELLAMFSRTMNFFVRYIQECHVLSTFLEERTEDLRQTIKSV